MPGYKTIRVTLESEIEHAALMASIRLERSGKTPDITLKWHPGRKGWTFTCTVRGEEREYLVLMHNPYLNRPSPKKQSAQPVNISGLSLKDRQALLEALNKLN